MQSKFGMWLIMLLAAFYLARPQGAKVTENTQHYIDHIAGAEYANEGSDNESDIIMIVLIVILIGIIADACAEVDYEN